MDKKRNLAILTVVALWSAGFYALIWSIISIFVSADTVSHYYVDFEMSRWWGALFVPIYAVVVISAYLLCAHHVGGHYKNFSKIILAVGLGLGISVSIICADSGSILVESSGQILIALFFMSAFCCFLLYFFGFCCNVEKKKFDEIAMLTGCGFGLFSWGMGFGLGFAFSVVTVFPVVFCLLFDIALGCVAGASCGFVLSMLVLGLINLHKLALGIKDKKDEDNEYNEEDESSFDKDTKDK